MWAMENHFQIEYHILLNMDIRTEVYIIIVQK